MLIVHAARDRPRVAVGDDGSVIPRALACDCMKEGHCGQYGTTQLSATWRLYS